MGSRRAFLTKTLAGGIAATGLMAGSALAQSDTMTDVSLGIPFAAATYLPPILGVDMGLFEAQGIALEVEYIQPGPLIPAVASGAVEFGLLPGPVPHEMMMAGAGSTMLMTTVKRPEVRLMATPGTGSVEALRGYPVAVGAAGSSMTRLFMLQALRDAGLDPDADVKHRTLAGQGDSMNALLSGQVNAAVLGLPFFLMAETRGSEVLVDYTSEDAGAWPSNNLVGLEGWIEDNADVTARFLRGYLDALDAWETDADAAIAVIMREARIDDNELARLMYDVSLQLLSTGADAIPTESEHQAVIDMLLEVSSEDPGVRSPEGTRVGDYYHDQYIRDALER